MQTHYKFLLIFLFLGLLSIPGKAQNTKTRIYGSPRGMSFSSTCTNLKEVRIRAGHWIDAIQVACQNGSVNSNRGGNGGTLYRFALRSGERITRITGTYNGPGGAVIHTLRIYTNQRASPTYGLKPGRTPFNIQVPNGATVVGFTGRSSTFLDAIGLVYRRSNPNPNPNPVNARVSLSSPSNGATLDNGCSNQSDNINWPFRWARVNGATRYHLLVYKNADRPLLDNANLGTNYYNFLRQSYITDANRYGWTWKVRALVNGRWTSWSTRTFNVEPINTDCRVALAPVTLSSPSNNATLDNGCSTNRNNRTQWNFAWQRQNGATRYHLMVYKNASRPVVNIQNISSNSYAYTGRVGSYITDANRYGWTWKVRAFANGQWGPWSRLRTFNVEKLNTDCGGSQGQVVNYKVVFQNSSIFVAKFKMTYTLNGQTKVISTDNKAPGWKKTYYVPSNARNVKIVIRYLKQFTWTELYSNILGRITRNDCFRINTSGLSARLSRGGC